MLPQIAELEHLMEFQGVAPPGMVQDRLRQSEAESPSQSSIDASKVCGA